MTDVAEQDLTGSTFRRVLLRDATFHDADLSGARFRAVYLDGVRMTGVEVVRWLRDRPDVAPDLRIVVISAWAGENRAVLQELGITTVMQKPLRIQQLTDLIAETLRDLES